MLVNLGTPDGTDFRSMWRYLREFLSDPRVIELPRIVWYPILYGIVLNTRPGEVGRQLHARSGTPRRTSRRCAPIRAARARSLPPPLPASPTSSSTGRCATARPRRRASCDRLVDAGCDRIVSVAALSAIFGDDDGDGQRPAVPRADEAALGAGRAHRAALSRRARLYRRPGAHRSRSIWQRWISSPRWSSPPITASRKPYFEKGDPYHCHCQKTTRLLRARLGWEREEADHLLPVALRRAGMAAALYRQDGREAGEGRRQVDRRHQSGLLLRLHRDAGGNRPGSGARSSITPAARISRTSPASTTATRAWP